MARKMGRKIKKMTDDQMFEQMVAIHSVDELVPMILRYLALQNELVRRHGTWPKAKAKMNEYLHRSNIAAAE